MVMRKIGLDVAVPRKTCDDPECPFHGNLAVRGKMLTGTVVSAKMSTTVTVERDYLQYMKKYMRYEKRKSRIMAHNPPCVETKEGDVVKIVECRPLSKNVSFVVVEKTGGEV
jgi:small subunit ribosomal protein S17